MLVEVMALICDVVVVAQKGDDKVELSRTTFTVKQQSKKNAQQQ